MTASEVDPFATAAIGLNAALNGVEIAVFEADVIDDAPGDRTDWDVVLAGDVFYERDLAARVEPWLRSKNGNGMDSPTTKPTELLSGITRTPPVTVRLGKA